MNHSGQTHTKFLISRGLKGNHGTAHQEVKSFLDDAIAQKAEHLKSMESVEKDHGRIETRRVWITEEIDWFADVGKWENLKSFDAVGLKRETPTEATSERRYFLTSLPADVKNFARAVRGHRETKNSLHWVLDVSTNEDPPRSRTGIAAENLVLMRKISLNSLLKKSDGSKRTHQSQASPVRAQ